MKVTSLPSISDRIESAFKTASKTTGTGFDFLVNTALRESNLDADAKAPTSSAAGMFQFIESTWLEMVKEAGPEFGLSEAADQISQNSKGKYVVADAGERQKILDLRYDPEISAMMTAAYAKKNAATLHDKIGRTPTNGELYIAHFLGPNGGSRLINAVADDPEASAAQMFPTQARANRSIFYDGGRARSVAELYGELVSRHQDPAPVMLASAEAGEAAETDAPSMVSAYSGFKARDPAAVFDAFFRTDGKGEKPVSVEAFWASFGEQAETEAAQRPAAPEVPRPVPSPRGAIGVWSAHLDNEPLDLTSFLEHPLIRS